MTEHNEQIDPGRRRKLEEAAHWVVQLDDAEFSPKRHQEWTRWLEQDPENSEVFDQILTLVGLLDEHKEELATIPIPDARTNKHANGDETPGSGKGPRQERPYRRWGAVLLAASLTGLAILTSVTVIDRKSTDGVASQSLRYETAPSVHRRVQLEDGSVVELGADSALTSDYSTRRRTVILDKGEALFTVSKDPARPFVVIAGRGRITAVGTEFNVRRDSDRVVVTVTEGSVDVAPQLESTQGEDSAGFPIDGPRRDESTRLSVGQQLVLDSSGSSGVTTTDPSIATSWKDGRLQYLREPLSSVVSGVNRYSDLKIVIADSELNDLLFTGTIFNGRTREWLEGVSTVLPVQVQFVGNRTALLKTKRPASEI